jgi:hypothetical protein
MSPPGQRTSRQLHRRRDAGLRRISSATRGLAASALALVGAFTAFAAHTQAGAKGSAPARTPATTPASGALAAPRATVGTLPPDTFPASGDTTPPTAAAVPQPPQAAPQNVPDTVPQTVPPIVSGSS